MAPSAAHSTMPHGGVALPVEEQDVVGERRDGRPVLGEALLPAQQGHRTLVAEGVGLEDASGVVHPDPPKTVLACGQGFGTARVDGGWERCRRLVGPVSGAVGDHPRQRTAHEGRGSEGDGRPQPPTTAPSTGPASQGLRFGRAASRELLDEGTSRGGTSRRVDRQSIDERAAHGSDVLGGHAGPVEGGIGRRDAPGEQLERRGREGVHVCRRADGATARRLGSGVRECGAVRPPPVRGGQPEVDEDRSRTGSVVGDHDVGGLHVAVHDRWFVPVKMIESGRDVRHHGNHGVEGQTGGSLPAKPGPKVLAADPVEHQEVVVALEEVISDDRNVRMRPERQERARLLQEGRPVDAVRDGGDLEGHRTRVVVIPRPQHVALTASAGELERLVTVAEQLGGDRARAVERFDP